MYLENYRYRSQAFDIKIKAISVTSRTCLISDVFLAEHSFPEYSVPVV